MRDQEPLFEVERSHICEGCSVIVQTIWGDEHGRVVDFELGGLAVVALERGDVIAISVARLVEIEGERGA